MRFKLYLNVAERLNEIGRGEFDSPSEAFLTMAGEHYKLPIQMGQFELNEINGRTFQILTSNAEYILIEQIDLPES